MRSLPLFLTCLIAYPCIVASTSFAVPCCNLSVLQQFVANSTSGDTFLLGAGTWTGCPMVDDRIHLAARNNSYSYVGNQAGTTIDCQYQGGPIFGFNINNALPGLNISMQHLTFTRGYYYSTIRIIDRQSPSVSLSLYNVTIRDQAGMWGSPALYYLANGNLTVDQCSFMNINNSGRLDSKGGAILAESTGANIVISNTRVVNATGGYGIASPLAGGGGIFIGDPNSARSNVRLINVTVSNCFAGAGGAVSLAGADMTFYVEGCNFSGNTAIDNGGGVTTQQVSSPPVARNVYVFRNTIIANNVVLNGRGCGMLLRSYNTSYTFDNVTISGNNILATGHGGGIAVMAFSTLNMVFRSCVFDSNSAVNVGGAFAVDQGTTGNASFVGCRFRNNIGIHGGAVYIEYPSSFAATFANSTFVGNLAPGGNGGAIYAKGADVGCPSYVVSGCSFISNAASVGGGIYATNISVLHSIFNQNTASGAAFYVSLNAWVDLTNTFSNNYDYSYSPYVGYMGSGGCYRGSSLAFEAARESQCSGLPGYPCLVNCLNPNQVASTANASLTCDDLSGYYTGATVCVPQNNVRASWVWGFKTYAELSHYGTLGVWSPSNVIGGRRGAAWAVHPRDPSSVIVYGGAGYNDVAQTNDGSGYGSITLADTWNVSLATGDSSHQTWIAGPHNDSFQTYMNLTTGQPGARRLASMWSDSTTNCMYLFGGNGATLNATFQLHNDIWCLPLNTSVPTWQYVGGGLYGNEGGSSSALGVTAPSNWPGARYGALLFTFVAAPRMVFVYGGYGYGRGTEGNGGLPGFGNGQTYLGDLHRYDIQSNQWTWLSGLFDVGSLSYPTVRGTINVANAANYPGTRYASGHCIDTVNDVVYLFGGTTSNCVMNDLWRGTYNAATRNITWTWILGPADCSQPDGVYRQGSMTGGYCTGCFPGARGTSHLFFFRTLSVTAGVSYVYLFGGSSPSGNVLNDVWVIKVGDAVPTAMMLAGSRYVNAPVIYPATLQAPLAPFTPGGRQYAIHLPDPVRLARLHVIGGQGVQSDVGGNIRPSNDAWIMTFVQTLLLNVMAPAVEIGVPFNITGRVALHGGDVSPTLNLGSLSVRVINNVTGADVTLLSAVSASGFVDGRLAMTIWAVPTGHQSAFVINITTPDLAASVTVVVACSAACDMTCVGAGAPNCTCAGGYYMTLLPAPYDHKCVTVCPTGSFLNGSFCVPCTTGCAACTKAGLTLASCGACDEANGWGLRGFTCIVCTGGGNVLYQGVCSACPAVYGCAAPQNVTCPPGGPSTCPSGCLPNQFLTSGQAAAISDTCTVCSNCPSGKFRSTPCSAQADAICSDCATCGLGQYVSTRCNTTGTDTVCGSCTPVAGCGTQVICNDAVSSTCGFCADGFYLRRVANRSDECIPCSTCPVGQYAASACQGAANVTCAACQTGCVACSGNSLVLPTCSRCDEAQGFLIDVGGIQCTHGCGTSEWHNTTTPGLARCTACDTGCVVCNGSGLELLSGQSCSVCDEPHGYLIDLAGERCSHGCPTGQYVNASVTSPRCASCGENNCAPGYYLTCTGDSSFTCVKCTTGCLSCTGPGLPVEAGGGECISCDESLGFTLSDDRTTCSPCAANCSRCSGSPSSCTVCASGYDTGTPGCAPKCSSPGCLSCQSPESCASICKPAFAGDGCFSCSSVANPGNYYPDCVPARVVDATATGTTLGVLGLLVVVVLILALQFPLAIFYSTLQTIVTPGARIPMVIDFILSSRALTLTVTPTVDIKQVSLEGTGLLPGSLIFDKTENETNGVYTQKMHLGHKQTRHLLQGGYHVDLLADAGMGPVTTAHPVSFRMRANPANALVIFTLIVEFIQLSSFTFGSDGAWWSEDPVPHTLHYSLIVLPSLDGLWYILFWAFAGVALIFCICVLMLKLKIDHKLRRSSAYAAFSNGLFGTILPFIGGTLYMPIISVMLSVLACSREVTAPDSPFTANYAQNLVACWKGDHLIYAAVAIFTVVTFYPTAVFTLPVWQTLNEGLDARFFPKYLVVTGQVKFVLAVCNQMLASVPYLRAILLIVFSVPVMVFVIVRPPSVIYHLQYIVFATYAAVAWAGVSSLIATLIVPDSFISAIILYGGWGLVFIVSLILELRPRHKEGEHVSRNALDRVFGVDADDVGTSKAQSTSSAAYVTPATDAQVADDVDAPDETAGDADPDQDTDEQNNSVAVRKDPSLSSPVS